MKQNANSIKGQKLAGTYDRNREWCALVKSGKARQVDLARKEGVSRQCVNQIIQRANQKPQNLFLRFFNFLGNLIHSMIEGDRR